MFRIKADDNIIYDPRVDSIKIASGSLTQEVNLASLFEFCIYPTHPAYTSLEKMRTVVSVYDDSLMLFRGRIISDPVGLYKEKKIVCEGELAFLRDSYLAPYSWENGGVRAYLEMLIANHNSQVDDSKKFVLRDCDVVDPNDYIVRSNEEYTNTWQELKEKILDNPDTKGFLFLERDEEFGVTYIDYLANSPYQSQQKIELGKNITGLNIESNVSEIATAVIPLGAKLKDEEGNETGERLTIDDLFIQDEEKVTQYGFICKSVIHENITDKANLLQAGDADLARLSAESKSLSITAVDLEKAGLATDTIRHLEYVEVESKPHGLTGRVLITKLTIDLLNPSANQIQIGSDYGSFSQNHRKGQKEIIKSIVSSETSEQRANIFNQFINLHSQIDILSDSISSVVAEEKITNDGIRQSISTVQTMIEQTSSDLTIKFGNLEQDITNISGDSQDKFVNIEKYIRFIDGDIVLGEAGNPNELRIKKERISFLQSDVEIAYISNNKLTIKNAQINEGLGIGKFAFIPRENGNLSFNCVG